ncbi:hypothetical protein CTAYLR_000748 [Chrysophaeum taylorii]|uniref:Phytase-like domain-containing protein n=1 Tax=Chrysophaeum taylorii TaxID=2483200 RepID=A0AAD7URP8_9STRA|nr:hypothetical protein CTAYLR_000748 [Chrysophaeum taylorii]
MVARRLGFSAMAAGTVLSQLAASLELTRIGEILVDNDPLGIKGISGVCYDGTYYYGVDDERPYIFAFDLNFDASAYDVLNRTHVKEDGTKFEDCTVQTTSSARPRLWTVSEINDMKYDGSRDVEPIYFGLTIDEPGEDDETNLRRSDLTQDRCARDSPPIVTFLAFDLDAPGSRVGPSEELLLPHADFHYGRTFYNRDWRKCDGSRPYRGLQGSSISPSGARLLAAEEAALYQDDRPPTYYDGSKTRILLYDVIDADAGVGGVTLTKTLNYYVEPLHERPPRPWSTAWSGITGVVALEDDHFLVLEVSFVKGKRTRARIFELTPDAVAGAPDVTDCRKLESHDCGSDDTLVSKRLVLDMKDIDFNFVDTDDTLEWDGITMGETLADGTPTLVLANDVDGASSQRLDGRGTRPIDSSGDKTDGTVFAMFALNASGFSEYSSDFVPTKRSAPKSLVVLGTTIVAAAFVAFFAAMWYFGLSKLRRRVLFFPAQVEEPRMIKLVAGLLRSFFFGGLAFGWPAMQIIARQRGLYGHLCVCGVECSNMRASFALVGAVGFVLTIGSQLLWGMCLDQLGPKVTSTTGLLVVAVGFFTLACMNEKEVLFLLGWSFLAVGGGAVHVANFHIQNLFPNARNAVSGAFSMALVGSALIFPILQLNLQRFTSAKTFKFVTWNLGNVCLGFCAHAFCAQPWVAYPKPKMQKRKKRMQQASPTPSCCQEQYATSTSPCLSLASKLCAYKPTNNLHALSLRDQLTTFEFIAEALYFSFSMLLIQLYLATISNQLVYKGDRTFSTLPHERTDSVYTKMAGFFHGFGGLWFPFNACLLEDASIAIAIVVQCVFSLVFHLVLLVPNLPVAVVAMVAHAGARYLLYCIHSAYIARVFGLKNFVKLNGITCLAAGVVGFLSYPLQLNVIFWLNGNYTIQNISGAALSIVLMLFPLILAIKPECKRAPRAPNALPLANAPVASKSAERDLEGQEVDTKESDEQLREKQRKLKLEEDLEDEDDDDDDEEEGIMVQGYKGPEPDDFDETGSDPRAHVDEDDNEDIKSDGLQDLEDHEIGVAAPLPAEGTGLPEIELHKWDDDDNDDNNNFDETGENGIMDFPETAQGLKLPRDDEEEAPSLD